MSTSAINVILFIINLATDARAVNIAVEQEAVAWQRMPDGICGKFLIYINYKPAHTDLM